MRALVCKLGVIIKALTLGITCSLVVLGVTALAWSVRKGSLLVVQTASMQPTLAPHDLVVVERIDPAQLVPGDVVSYRSLANPKVIITHRFISYDAVRDTYTMQGDGVQESDPPIPPSAIAGRVGWVVPGAGKLQKLLTRPLGLVILVDLPVTFMMGFEYRKFLLKKLTLHYKLL